MADPSELRINYGRVRGRLVELGRSLSPEEARTPVPATPGWTIHNVFSHLAGNVAGAIAGIKPRITDPTWTGAQVAERLEWTTNAVLDEWLANSEAFDPILDDMAKAGRNAAAFDAVVHEQDILGALGRSAQRDEPVITTATIGILTFGLGSAIDTHALTPLRIVTEFETIESGTGEDRAELRAPRFELFRAAFGRRSASQVTAFDWSVDPAPYLPHFFVFGPRDTELVEP